MPFERLHNAVTTLISGDSLSKNLASAALTILPLRSSDFPTAATREQFDAIKGILDRHGTWEATVNAMDPAERHRAAGMIVLLFAEVARAERSKRRPS